MFREWAEAKVQRESLCCLLRLKDAIKITLRSSSHDKRRKWKIDSRFPFKGSDDAEFLSPLSRCVFLHFGEAKETRVVKVWIFEVNFRERKTSLCAWRIEIVGRCKNALCIVWPQLATLKQCSAIIFNFQVLLFSLISLSGNLAKFFCCWRRTWNMKLLRSAIMGCQRSRGRSANNEAACWWPSSFSYSANLSEPLELRSPRHRAIEPDPTLFIHFRIVSRFMTGSSAANRKKNFTI